ncbi:MAG: TolC family protein [Planctomycetota bacterium]
MGLLLGAGALAGQDEAGEPEPRRARDLPLRLSLQDAVDLGLARNLGLRSERLTVLMARLDTQVEEAAWDPTLAASVAGGESKSPSRSQLAGADVVDSDNFNFAVGVTKPLRMGPVLGLEWRSDRFFSNSTFNTINPAYEGALELTLTVPLLRGRGRRANEALLRSTRSRAEQSWNDFRAATAQVVEEISTAYWNLVYFRGQVEVVEKSWDVARELEEAERLKLEAGTGTRLEVVKARAQSKRREADWIAGRGTAAGAADRLRSLILPFLAKADDGLELVPRGVPGGRVEPPDLGEAVARALANRPEMRRADLEIERLTYRIHQAEDRVRPQLDLRGSVSSRATQDDFGKSAREVADSEVISAQASLNLSYPFGRRAAKHELRRSILERDRAVLARLETLNDIVVEVREAHRTLLTTGDEQAASLEEVAAQEEALRGERQRLKRGESILLAVSEIEEDLTSARLRELKARVDLENARVRLRRVTGNVLDDFGIHFDADLRPVRGKAADTGTGPAPAGR